MYTVLYPLCCTEILGFCCNSRNKNRAMKYWFSRHRHRLVQNDIIRNMNIQLTIRCQIYLNFMAMIIRTPTGKAYFTILLFIISNINNIKYNITLYKRHHHYRHFDITVILFSLYLIAPLLQHVLHVYLIFVIITVDLCYYIANIYYQYMYVFLMSL